jgi:hypothetical protein
MRKIDLMLQSIDDLEEYILNLGDANLLPPSLYMLEDDTYLSVSVKKGVRAAIEIDMKI